MKNRVKGRTRRKGELVVSKNQMEGIKNQEVGKAR
jgi:hypothetical protein